jgi:hypothetical protein
MFASRFLRPWLVFPVDVAMLMFLVSVHIGHASAAAGLDDLPPSSTSALHDSNASLFLQSLARDSFFHFVEPGFSPFICSRRAQHLHHPLVLRLTDEAVIKLRSTRASIFRIDAAILHSPDVDTGECPSHPDPKSISNISWYGTLSAHAAFSLTYIAGTTNRTYTMHLLLKSLGILR